MTAALYELFLLGNSTQHCQVGYTGNAHVLLFNVIADLES